LTSTLFFFVKHYSNHYYKVSEQTHNLPVFSESSHVGSCQSKTGTASQPLLHHPVQGAHMFNSATQTENRGTELVKTVATFTLKKDCSASKGFLQRERTFQTSFPFLACSSVTQLVWYSLCSLQNKF